MFPPQGPACGVLGHWRSHGTSAQVPLVHFWGLCREGRQGDKQGMDKGPSLAGDTDIDLPTEAGKSCRGSWFQDGGAVTEMLS